MVMVSTLVSLAQETTPGQWARRQNMVHVGDSLFFPMVLTKSLRNFSPNISSVPTILLQVPAATATRELPTRLPSGSSKNTKASPLPYSQLALNAALGCSMLLTTVCTTMLKVCPKILQMNISSHSSRRTATSSYTALAPRSSYSRRRAS